MSYSGGDPLFQRIVSFSRSTKVEEEELTHISREHYQFISQPRFCPSYGFRHKNVMKDERDGKPRDEIDLLEWYSAPGLIN